jgi:hypothetical protein
MAKLYIQLVICVLVLSSFCMLNFMLPTCSSNFAEVARFTYEVDQASNIGLVMSV